MSVFLEPTVKNCSIFLNAHKMSCFDLKEKNQKVLKKHSSKVSAFEAILQLTCCDEILIKISLGVDGWKN